MKKFLALILALGCMSAVAEEIDWRALEGTELMVYVGCDEEHGAAVVKAFEEKTGKKGMMVSAVDLLKGIAVGAGMGVALVEGANGGLHTNYAGKVDAAIKSVTEDGYDFTYIHVEAPDEMGHQGSMERKVQAIEYLDEKVIGPMCEKLESAGADFRMLVLPDHPTPIRVRTHTSDNVPYMLYDSTAKQDNTWNYNEEEAKNSGNLETVGHKLIDKLLQL